MEFNDRYLHLCFSYCNMSKCLAWKIFETEPLYLWSIPLLPPLAAEHSLCAGVSCYLATALSLPLAARGEETWTTKTLRWSNFHIQIERTLWISSVADGGLTERSLEKSHYFDMCVFFITEYCKCKPLLQFCLFSDSDTEWSIFEFVQAREKRDEAHTYLADSWSFLSSFSPFLLCNCKRIYSCFVAGLFTAASR